MHQVGTKKFPTRQNVFKGCVISFGQVGIFRLTIITFETFVQSFNFKKINDLKFCKEYIGMFCRPVTGSGIYSTTVHQVGTTKFLTRQNVFRGV